jgi:D-alanyl-D-alanine carboxypeptidase (penicillin-binding protein 5/6)
MDAATGAVLYEKNADEEIPPASLAKLMTMHIALREVKAGRASLDEIVPLPRESWAVNQPPRSSLMFLAPGQRVSLRELLLGLAIPSGNDAAVAAALRFAPTVAGFVEEMNREAERLGLVRTRFVEPSGISEYNLTTAREFAAFCRIYLTLHPETLGDYHSAAEFAYPKEANVAEAFRNRPGTIVQYNHNNLLKDFPGTDGLKTGYIDEAGYNIALTAERRGTRLIAVILGGPAVRGGDRIRDEDGRKLLEWGFRNYKTIRPVIEPLEPVRVWKGKINQTDLVPALALEFTAPANRGADLRGEAELDSPLIAPLPAGSAAGTFILYDNFGELRRVPLLTVQAVEQGGFFKRLWDSIRLFFKFF